MDQTETCRTVERRPTSGEATATVVDGPVLSAVGRGPHWISLSNRPARIRAGRKLDNRNRSHHVSVAHPGLGDEVAGP